MKQAILSITTRNIVGIPSKSLEWTTLAGLLILALLGVYFFLKKPKYQEQKHTKSKITKK